MTAADREAGRVPASRLIFWLFVALAIVTAAALLAFVRFMGDCDRDGIEDRFDTSIVCNKGGPYDGTHVTKVVYRALAGDLAAPIVAWFLIKAIHRRRQRRVPAP